MDALLRGAGLGWERQMTTQGKIPPRPLKIGPFLLGGKGPVHDLSLIDVTRRGVYLTFPEGVRPAENEVYRVVRSVGWRSDPVLAPNRPRRIVAKVRIVSVMERSRALVQVLAGSVIHGIGAEKVL